ncbi:MAG: radical SAM protein [Pseudomonadota bacterium]
MRVLLVFPGLHHENAFPLGLAYLAAGLRHVGHEVLGCDLGLEPPATLRRRLDEGRPDLVGIAIWAANTRRAAEAARLVRAHSRARLVVGGPHATIAPAEVLRATGAEVALLGEADRSLVTLADAAARGEALRGLPGTAWLDERGASHLGSAAADPTDLDALPAPDREVFVLARYRRGWVRGAPLRAPLLTSRGCPAGCAHCSAPALHRGRWRPRSPAAVVAEAVALAREHGAGWIDVEDEQPLVDRDRFLEICARWAQAPGAPAWGCPNGLRPEALDEPLVAAMAHAGCRHIALGVEAASPEVLAALGRHPELEPSRAAVRWCREHGIDVAAYFMLGLPGEEPGASRAALRAAQTLAPSSAHFSVYRPIPGARLAAEAIPDPRAVRARRALLYLAWYGHPGRARRVLAHAGARPGDWPAALGRFGAWLRGDLGWGG